MPLTLETKKRIVSRSGSNSDRGAGRHVDNSGDGPTLNSIVKAPRDDASANVSRAICRIFRSALGRIRTCDPLIRSPSRSKTRKDTEGQEAQNGALSRTLPARTYRRGKKRHEVVVALW